MTTEFIKSSANWQECPEGVLPEYAFVGRSNVGKSSLINMLIQHKGLAKVSSTPGKTQLINHYKVKDGNEDWFLVDLPGYGFARVGKDRMREFTVLLNDYLLHRTNLVNLFLLIDARHEPQQNDLDAIHSLGEAGVPFAIVFTKIDKLGSERLNKNLAHYIEHLHLTWETLPPVFRSSAEKNIGRNELLDYIYKCNSLYKS
jgi:GTP-binding protein